MIFPKINLRSNKGMKPKTKDSSSIFGALYYGGTSSYTQDKALLLSAVYRCVEVISNSVAQLPFEPYKRDSIGYKIKDINSSLYNILNTAPNERMTRYTFLKTLITSLLLKGNGYAYIERSVNGDPIALHYIPADFVTIIPPQLINEPVKYSITGIIGEVSHKDIIHIINFSYDGVLGVSTLTHARQTLGLATDAEVHATGFFAGGCNIGGVLEVPHVMRLEEQQKLKASWEQAFSPNTGKPNSVCILQNGMKFSPISINPQDSQLLQTRQFSVNEICRFFGVNPIQCYDMEHASYSTVEATTLAFLTDTIQPLLSKIELEFKKKLGIECNFDTTKLIRADKAALSTYYRELFNIGVLSPNEIRKELDLGPNSNGGDEAFVQVNIMPLKNAVNNMPTSDAVDNNKEEK